MAKLNGETFPTVLEAWEALRKGPGYADVVFYNDVKSRHQYINYLAETKQKSKMHQLSYYFEFSKRQVFPQLKARISGV